MCRSRNTSLHSIMQITMTEEATATPQSHACDCHFHVFRAHESSGGARYVPAYTSTLDDWANAARPLGVTRGVVVQPSFLGTDNTVLLGALAARSDTLRGVAVVAPDASVTELKALHAAGVRGVRLNFASVGDDTAKLREISPRWWSALIEAELHLELHTDAGRAAALLPLIPREITVVLDHFAKPKDISARDETLRAARERNSAGAATFVTLSGAYRQRADNALRCAEIASLWRNEIGVARLLWGSDWPCTNHEYAANYAALFEALNAWLPSTADRRAVLSDNPDSLYWR